MNIAASRVRGAPELLALLLTLACAGCVPGPAASGSAFGTATGTATGTASGTATGTAQGDRESDALLRLPRAAGAEEGRAPSDRVPDPAPRPPQLAAGSPAAASPRSAWRCADGARPETRWDVDSGDLILRLDGERLVLRSVRVASGAAWEGGPEGAVRFWNREDGALLGGPGRETLCRVDPVGTADLRAAAEGALFRALGNEPGWTLVIHPGRIDRVTDYGATRDSFRNPEMRVSGVLEIWEAGAGDRRLRVEIGPGPCLDASERSFPATVAVLEGDRRLPGCGSRLEPLPD